MLEKAKSKTVNVIRNIGRSVIKWKATDEQDLAEKTVMWEFELIQTFGASAISSKNKSLGICAVTEDVASYLCKMNVGFSTIRVLFPYFKSWESYSGITSYPVPTSKDDFKLDRGERVIRAADKFALERGKWDKKTEYGRLRFELLDHIVKEMTKDIQKGVDVLYVNG